MKEANGEYDVEVRTTWREEEGEDEEDNPLVNVDATVPEQEGQTIDTPRRKSVANELEYMPQKVEMKGERGWG